MLFLTGEATADVYRGLQVPAVTDDADPAGNNVFLTAKRALNEFFDPQRNTDFEKYNFRLLKQNVGEPIDGYLVRLRTAARYCEFANAGDEIRTHIIQTCMSSRLRRRALTEQGQTLAQLLTAARTMETADRHLQTMEKNSETLKHNTFVAAIQQQ